MDTILTATGGPGNEVTVVILLSLACFRIYLEVIGFDFNALPITRFMSGTRSCEQLARFHRLGFYFSVGYVLLWAPGILFS